jgi:adenylosuccinate lyase
VLSHEAAYQVKQLGLENDLIERVRKDEYFEPIKDELDGLVNPRSFIGRAPEQVDKFLTGWVTPALGESELKAAVEQGDKAILSV